MPAELIAEPARMSPSEQSTYGCEIGVAYPAPLVDHTEAVRAAKQKIYGVRRQAEARDEALAVFEKHGSRRRPSTRRARRT